MSQTQDASSGGLDDKKFGDVSIAKDILQLAEHDDFAGILSLAGTEISPASTKAAMRKGLIRRCKLFSSFI